MLPEIGLFLLILAFTNSFVLTISAKLNNKNVALTGSNLIMVSCSFIILSICFLQDDFSVNYVAKNSYSNLPNYYKFVAVWGSHEGSLLLFSLVLNFWIFIASCYFKKLNFKHESTTISIMSFVNSCILFMLIYNSSPFDRNMISPPVEGNDLNPLLQDWAMIIHPPTLYVGYVGLIVPFSLAVTYLIHKFDEKIFVNIAKPFTAVSWAALGLGIALGSFWAYYELGWGGWWFWDPVENSSFIPWITATALIHSLLHASNNKKFIHAAILLSILAFSFSLTGTFLVRSGIVSSVHSFASDPSRGTFILLFLGITTGGAFILYLKNIDEILIKSSRQRNNSLREKIVYIGILCISCIAFSVLLGTIYPLIFEVVFGKSISVGAPYFNSVFLPLLVPVIILMVPGLINNIYRSAIIITISLLISIFISILIKNTTIYTVLGFSASIMLLASSVVFIIKSKSFSALPAFLGHSGLAITIIGVTIVSNFEIEKDVEIAVGETISIANHEIKFNKISIQKGPNYISHIGRFAVNDGKKEETLYPEKRVYIAREMPMSEAAILSTIFKDIYISLGEPLTPTSWSARIYYKPFVSWIWAGSVIFMISAFLSLILTRRRNVK